MNTTGHLLRKEFLQVFRNRPMLVIILALPAVQLVVLSFAATFDVRNANLVVLDHDGSSTSRTLVERFQASGYYTLVDRVFDADVADRLMLGGEADAVLRIPARFGQDILDQGSADLHLTLDAVDGATAGVIQAYALQIIAGHSIDVATNLGVRPAAAGNPRVDVRPAFWYNPHLDYTTYMVPGILVVLVTMIGLFLTSMNIVREKELGTIEQLNVTPMAKHHFIVGKLLPFWIIGMVELSVGLIIARLLFDIPMLGSPALVFLVAAVYLVTVLGVGLFISTRSDTQQQAMFLAWFIMVVFLLMSGLFTPIESMPEWARTLTLFNPVAHFIEVMRRVLLKGADFAAISTQFWTLVLFSAAILTLAVRQYRKVTA